MEKRICPRCGTEQLWDELWGFSGCDPLIFPGITACMIYQHKKGLVDLSEIIEIKNLKN